MTVTIIEDKTGRRAIQVRYFIDATGDGDVITRLGLSPTHKDDLQPPTVCVHLNGMDTVIAQNLGFELAATAHDAQYLNALKQGFLWHSEVVGIPIP